ncbi:hypothetical protein EN829_031270 [Mesorhizobium sp. M00.F.Ca.ET.186.01.1.1]|nr:hypothetical protein EN829_031270 [Mesorhizobium sp. M00.F.Ca.ET.186.01.1.1]
MSDDRNHRETGARKYPAKTNADPSDQFSQDAAGNRRPASGEGLTRRKDEEGSGRQPAGRPGSTQAGKSRTDG